MRAGKKGPFAFVQRGWWNPPPGSLPTPTLDLISSQEQAWVHLLLLCCVSREAVGFHCDSWVLFMATTLVETDRRRDTGSESVSPLFIQRFFWNAPNMLVQGKEKNSLSGGEFRQLLPTLFVPKQHLVQVSTWLNWKYFAGCWHLDNYALLSFACEERCCLSLPTPLLVTLISAGWYLRSLA